VRLGPDRPHDTPEAAAIETTLYHLRRSAALAGEGRLTGGELLERFVTRRDGPAFAALVRRHGPMVLGVCRRVLRNEADAEDAFQATFLVLARKAATVRPRGMVGNWLYGVAHRTALKARATRARRSAREREAAARPRPGAGEAREHLRALLDRELQALPDRYRAAVVLCDLEGTTIKEAARQLGCPPGTAWSWLSRGRSLLAVRLARRGLAVSGGAAAAAATGVDAAGVPVRLASSTVEAAALVAAGRAVGGVVGAGTAALAEGVVRAMFRSKLKAGACVALVVALGLGMGTGPLLRPAEAGGPAAAPQERPQGPTDSAQRAAAELAEARAALKRAEADLAVAQTRVARKEAEYRDARQGGAPAGGEAGPGAWASAVTGRFKFRIPVETGLTETEGGGRIEILEVWGTRPQIEVGGQYLVRGRYAMPSHERGTLYFYLTANNWNNSGPNLDLQQTAVRKGEGEFALVHAMAGPGYFHLQLIGEDGGRSAMVANVYFGTGENVRRTPWK
jgi:RNA polymerase sigma factor (sigma-70 family)